MFVPIVLYIFIFRRKLSFCYEKDIGRAAETSEVVDLIEYLCLEKAAFITGTDYLIDGGRSCGVISRTGSGK